MLFLSVYFLTLVVFNRDKIFECGCQRIVYFKGGT